NNMYGLASQHIPIAHMSFNRAAESIIFCDLLLIRALGGFGRVTPAVVIQLFVCDLKVCIRRMIGIRGEFPVKPEGTYVGRVLEPRAPAIERRIGNRQREFAVFALGLAHGKSVFTD